MNEERSEAFDESPFGDDDDWSHRVLCSDGNCIGVIGPDKCCKECGKPYEGTLPSGFSQLDDSASDDIAGDGEVSEEKEERATTAGFPGKESSSSDDEWENRILCSDGNCIGVIGPDGNCKECGKPYDPNAAE